MNGYSFFGSKQRPVHTNALLKASAASVSCKNEKSSTTTLRVATRNLLSSCATLPITLVATLLSAYPLYAEDLRGAQGGITVTIRGELTSTRGGYGNGWGGVEGENNGAGNASVHGRGGNGQDSNNGLAGGEGGEAGAFIITPGVMTITGHAGNNKIVDPRVEYGGAQLPADVQWHGPGGGGGGAGVYLGGGDHASHKGLDIIGGKGGGTSAASYSGSPHPVDWGSWAGSGGGGGAGVIVDGGTFKHVVEARIIGGEGGYNQPLISGGVLGAAGGGGDAVVVQSGATFTNLGLVKGGEGGGKDAEGISPGELSGGKSPNLSGNGGAGIRTGDNATVFNSGTVIAGASYWQGYPFNGVLNATGAIEFSGSASKVELHDGSVIEGDIKLFGIDNTLELHAGTIKISGHASGQPGSKGSVLALGGVTDSDFSVDTIGTGKKFSAFEIYKKSGSSIWNLKNETTAITPWQIEQGTLSLAKAGSLGAPAGTVAINGGTLAVEASLNLPQAITVGAQSGAINTFGNNLLLTSAVSGIGTLKKMGEGALILTADGNNFASGVEIKAGMIKVGNGGTTGSITGNVINDGILQFNRQGNLIVAGNISGKGSLQQSGTGTTILAGNTTSSGGVKIDKGVLQIGNGGNTGSITDNINNNGILRFNRSDSVIYSGSLSGKGSLQQSGTGTTILTGNTTSSGGVKIDKGVLQIGNGGNTGSIIGDITNNGTLRFDRSDSLTFGGKISGAGSIENAGNGTTILTGDLASDGGILINKGVVQIGNGGAAKSLNADIRNNAALVFNTSTELTYGKSLSGTGKTDVATASSLRMDGDSSAYSGAMAVHGNLIVNGTLGGNVNVEAQGRLSGKGNLAQLATIKDAGTLFSNTAKSLVFTGGLTLNPGSNVDVYLGLPQSSAIFDVTGPLTLGGKLNIIDNGGFQKGVYPIFSYSGSVTGDQNSMSIGSVPQSAQRNHLSIQMTSDRVNLLNAAGDVFNYWDGAGIPANRVVDGGNGTWNASQQNWTGSDGAVNLPWQGRQFGIFSGAAGVVRVDNSQGQVQTSGFQALVDGYHIEGNPLTLKAEDSTKPIIAVGTPDAVSGNMRMTIDSVLAGTDGFVKTMAGTLVLTADNSFTGSTEIRHGTLQIGNDGTTGSVSGDIVIGTQQGLRADLTILKQGNTILHQKLTGTGGLNITSNPGSAAQPDGYKTILTNDNSYTGGTIVHNAVLQLGEESGAGTTGSIAGNIALAQGRFAIQRAGNVMINGDITGNGEVTISGANTTILSGDNSFKGSLSVNKGSILEVENDWNLGDISTRLILDDAVLRLKGEGYLFNNREIEIGSHDATIEADKTVVGFDPEIASNISGTGKLIKTGDGTLILSGKNSYTGGTRIEEGGIQLGASWMADDVNPVTGDYVLVTPGSHLRFGFNEDQLFAGQISGSGNVELAGRGMVTFVGDQQYTGDTLIGQSSTLRLGDENGTASLLGKVVVDGLLIGDGKVGSIINSGAIITSRQSAAGALTVTGDYIGNDGFLSLGRDLGDDHSGGDQLIVQGNTSGATRVSVHNRSGIGGQTINGIRIIEVGGQSDGVFNLIGDYQSVDGTQAVVAGAYAYGLYKGSAANPKDGNWYLRSKSINPDNPTNSGGPDGTDRPDITSDGASPASQRQYQAGVPVYGAAQVALGRINREGFASLASRMTPGQNASNTSVGENDGETGRDRLFWGRAQSGYGKMDPQGNLTATTFGSHDWLLQSGVDAQFLDIERGSLFGSVWGDYQRSQVNVWSNLGNGKVTINGYGIGGALSWYGTNGYYLDGQGKATWYKSDFQSSRVDKELASDVSSFGYALSLEAGKTIQLSDRWSVTPQAQLIWASAKTESFHDVFNAQVVAPNNSSLLGRIGIAGSYSTSWHDGDNTIRRLSIGGIGNLYRELSGPAGYIIVSDTEIATGNLDKTWGEIGVTADYSWANNKYTVYGKLMGATSLDNFADSYSMTGNLGFRISW